MSIINRHIVREVTNRGYEYQNMDVLTRKVGIPKIAKFNALVKVANSSVVSLSNYSNVLRSLDFYQNMNNQIDCKKQIKEFNNLLRIEKGRNRKIAAYHISELYIKFFGKHLESKIN